MQSWSRKWWDQYRDRFILVSSLAVIEELSDGRSEKTQDRINLVKDLEMLSISARIHQITHIYIDRLIMPQDPFGDALHLAIASFHNVDALLTWNYKHIANLNKVYRIRQINSELGLPTPELVTPLNYLGVGD
jgi:predicted nucleic acid-binding protein